jgi:CRISPR system Cascade subunit CasD
MPAHHTLLLQLAGPLQSWGTSSRYSERDTGYEPSKSGIIGLVAAALGWNRDNDLSSLAYLRMGVRVDNEGIPGSDYQTAGAGDDHPGIAKAEENERQIQLRYTKTQSGRPWAKDLYTSLSKRYFLQDAVFLVGLEGDDFAFLQQLDAALRQPVYPIGLGRRSYVPSVPVALPGSGIREGRSLEVALGEEPWLFELLPSRRKRDIERDAQATARLVIEAPRGQNGDAIRNDQPVGAAFSTRIFGPRYVTFRPATPPRKETSDATA